MADVFLSYAREDHSSARRLVAELEEQGWSVWWDEEILSGVHYDELIENKIREVGCVVVLWSRHSVASSWVRAEATTGLHREMIISLRIEPGVELPIEFTNVSTIDLAIEESLANSPEFARILRDIEATVRRRRRPLPEPQTPVRPEAGKQPHEVPIGQKPIRKSQLLPLAGVLAGLLAIGVAGWFAWTSLYRRSPSLLLRPPPVALTALQDGGSIEIWVGRGTGRKKLAEEHCDCRSSFLLGRSQPLSPDLHRRWRLELTALQTLPESSSQFSQTLLDWEGQRPLQPRIPGFKLTPETPLEILVKSRPGKVVARAETIVGQETLIDILLVGV